MKPETIKALRERIELAETRPSADLETNGARFRFVGGAYEMSWGGVAGTSTMDEWQAVQSWIRAAKRKLEKAEAQHDQ